MAEEGFRLPGSGYEELVHIIVAYGTRDGASNPGDVGKLDPAHRASATRNAVLSATGVLRGGDKKLVTDRGRALARSLWRGTPDEARRRWREIVSTDEFLQNIVSAVKLRDGMARHALLAYIANAAPRVPRNNPTMSGAASVVELLKASGLLREDEGRLVASFGEPPVPDEDLPEHPGGEPVAILVPPAGRPREGLGELGRGRRPEPRCARGDTGSGPLHHR